MAPCPLTYYGPVPPHLLWPSAPSPTMAQCPLTYYGFYTRNAGCVMRAV